MFTASLAVSALHPIANQLRNNRLASVQTSRFFLNELNEFRANDTKKERSQNCSNRVAGLMEVSRRDVL